jgi:radical SAM superfamily enzyme YgiQ (UPF0313 family)
VQVDVMTTKKRGILLVYPPITKLERYSSAMGAAGGEQIPLGLYYLAAFVRQRGFDVDVIDAETQGLTNDDIIDRMREERFQVLGISSTTVAFHRARQLAEAVKDALPGTITVVGGPHVSSQPEHPMRFPAFDFALRNEGEQTLAELLDSVLGNGQTVSEIRGLVHRSNGQTVVNPPRPNVEDIDSLPLPAYDLIPDLGKYTPPPCNYKASPVANIITTRGCPNQCTFCDNNTFGRKLRIRSPESVVQEIELLMRSFGVREIAFVDDTFTIKPQRIYEIFELLRAKGLKFPWTCMARIDTVDEGLLRYMRENGCWHVSFGIESGDQNVLREIRKNITLEAVERVTELCHKLRILTKGFFMVGHPTDTAESIDRTIAFATRLKLDDVVVTINTPMPGSYQYEHAHEHGTLDVSDWSWFNYHNPVFVPNGLTREVLLTKHREFYRKFYLRPRIMWRYCRSFLGPTGPARLGKILSASRFLFQDCSKHRRRADYVATRPDVVTG